MSKKTDDTEKLKSTKQCFIITPIGQVGSEINKKAFGLIEAVINPVLSNHNFKAVAASDISSSGSINRQIIKHLTEDELVIANLTGLNANVMYELAVRHASRKPVILMIEEGYKLPFDVFDQRTVFYEDSLNGVKAAKINLEKFVLAALTDKEVSNPIYDSIEANLILQKITSEEKPLQYIIDRLDKIESNSKNDNLSFNFPNTKSNAGKEKAMWEINNLMDYYYDLNRKTNEFISLHDGEKIKILIDYAADYDVVTKNSVSYLELASIAASVVGYYDKLGI